MPHRTKILLIEDEVKLLMSMYQWLTERNYTVATASDAKAGFELAKKNDYSVIVSDIVMPQMTGLEVLRKLRSEGIFTPVILLTALGDVSDKIEGFEAGADDYLTKPFDFQELTLRIKAITRRSPSNFQTSNILEYGELSMNIDSKAFFRQGKKIELSPKEYELMEYFLRNPERVISKNEIAENVWKLNFDTGTNVIEVYINFLRKKIETNFEKKLIHTQFKVGYILKN